MNQPFTDINFEETLEELGLEKELEGEWSLQDNGIWLRPYISDAQSSELNLTYSGLKLVTRTDMHRYITQTDHILFRTPGKVEFLVGEELRRGLYRLHHFEEGNAIKIPPETLRRIIPYNHSILEIELIVQPRVNLKDEVHMQD